MCAALPKKCVPPLTATAAAACCDDMSSVAVVVVVEDAALSDENIISTWGLNENSGWILTSQGTVIKYESIAINSNNELTVPVPVILIFIAITIGIFYNKIVRIRYKK